MSREKTFPLKLSSTKHGALREQTHKHTSGSQIKIKVEYTLDSELRLVEPHLLENGEYESIQNIAGQRGMTIEDSLLEFKAKNEPIYYPLINSTYICIHNIELVKGKITRNTLSLFIPSELEKTKVICKDVSIMFPRQNREILAEKYLEYALSRVQ